MSEMVERLAEAIWRADPSRISMKWSECDEGFREIKRGQARAAIEAMREPNVAMRRSLMGSVDEFNVGDVWSAIITAAISE